MNPSLNKKFSYFFAFLFLIFVGMAVMVVQNASTFSKTSTRIRQSREFTFHLGQILFAATDAQTAVNDLYSKKGKQQWELFNRYASSILLHIELASMSMKENREQLRQLDELRDMVQNKMKFLGQFVERRKRMESETGTDEMVDVIASNKVGFVMDEIRNQITVLEAEEHRQMNALIDAQELQSKIFNRNFIALLASTLVIILSGFYYMLLVLRSRKRAEIQLNRAHNLLELRVQERTEELMNANKVMKGALAARRKAEDELLTINRFNYEIISNAGEGIIVYDEQLNHVLWNTFMEEMSGIPSHKVIGRKPQSLFPFLRGKGYFLVLNKVLKGETVHTPDVQIEVPDTNKKFWVSCIFSPHLNSNGNIIGVIGIIRDITSTKETQEDLMFIDKQLSTFIYKSSHDLKGPICSILGLSQLAKTEVKEPSAIQLFEMVENRTKKLDNILKGLIDTMTIKESTINPEHVDIDELLAESIKMLQDQPGFDKMEFRIKNQLKHAFFSDVNILRSILLSLISNSIKYRDPDSEKPFVDISVSEKDHEIMIDISDNGEGIKEEIQDKVFDIFFRGSQGSDGSGLGLYIAKNAVAKLHGKISMQSKENVGTRFSISFPKSLPQV